MNEKINCRGYRNWTVEYEINDIAVNCCMTCMINGVALINTK